MTNLYGLCVYFAHRLLMVQAEERTQTYCTCGFQPAVAQTAAAAVAAAVLVGHVSG